MPMAPPRACATCGQPGCVQHRRPAWGHAQPVARVRGRRLQQLRYQLFRGQPFCARCHVAVATIRDHVVPLAEGGSDLESNTQGLCQACSDAKTQTEARRGMARSR
jgi:5-methylcytosine-specific restriction protein A